MNVKLHCKKKKKKTWTCVLIAFKTRKQRGGPLNVPYGCSNKTTQSERRGAEEKLWPLAVYKAFPRLWTHWTEVLQRFHIKSISNVTAMHNYHKHQYHPGNWFSVQLPMSCLYSCNHVDEPAASTALVVEVLCSYVKQHTHTLFFFLSLSHTHTWSQSVMCPSVQFVNPVGILGFALRRISVSNSTSV